MGRESPPADARDRREERLPVRGGFQADQDLRPTRVQLEIGRRRSFASALDWPGWTRSGRTEAAALDALAGHALRYRTALEAIGVRLPPGAEDRIEVVERIPGDATTEFGAPARPAAAELTRPAAAAVDRALQLLEAAWAAFDAAVAGAPAELRKGPRGGGRDRDAIAEHVLSAESSYAAKLALRLRSPAHRDQPALAAYRKSIAAGIRDAATRWEPGARGWPALYAVRRIAWHALDHAWEIEDRSSAAPD